MLKCRNKKNAPAACRQHLGVVVMLLVAACCPAAADDDPVAAVQVMIGTSSAALPSAAQFGENTECFGQVLPAVFAPFGMTTWTPQTRQTEVKGVAPYYYDDTLWQGVRASHWLNGGCTQDYGSSTILLLTDSLSLAKVYDGVPFSHAAEAAHPDEYAVSLPTEGVEVSYTATCRCALLRFVVSKSTTAYLVVHPNSDENEGTATYDAGTGAVHVSNPVHRIYQGWGESAGFSGHSVVSCSRPCDDFGTYDGMTATRHATTLVGTNNGGMWLAYTVSAGDTLLVRVGTSFVDEEGARANALREIPSWDYETTRSALHTLWSDYLSAITFTTSDSSLRAQFYSALYRTAFLPRTMSDGDGRYPTFSSGTPSLLSAGTYYDDFSLWDTFRTQHPLLLLLCPSRAREMLSSLITKYHEGGWMPIFPCWNSYTAAMIGDHTAALFADAYAKGLQGVDYAAAYEGLRQNANDSPAEKDYRDGKGRRALASYLSYGYIPLEDTVPHAFHRREQVSRTLEYAYDDYCLSVLAEGLGHASDAVLFRQRAGNYRHVLSPTTGIAQGRYADGTFLSDDNARSFVPFITEGTPLQYTFFVPHDIPGLISAMGGREQFISTLDTLFASNHYWHGNEPCHHIPFLYHHVGETYKTQQIVRHILTTEYGAGPGGLAGNDDAGQMSAWYVCAAMGLSPLCPGTPYYALTVPLADEVVIRNEGGAPFILCCENTGEGNIYIQSATLDGVPFTRNYLTHDEITRGGTLVLTLCSTADSGWGTAPADCPPPFLTQ